MCLDSRRKVREAVIAFSKEEFSNVAQEIFDSLPDQFQLNIENVRIVIEDEPNSETIARTGVHSPGALLGLYEGIPLNKRGSWYGMSPVYPDTISLYKKNIERGARDLTEIHDRIRHVLIHEIAHYYGMNEDEVRAAGY